MFNLGWAEVSIILLIALVVFGPKKLPELGHSIGKTLRGFKEEIKGLSSTEEDEPSANE